MRAQGLRLRVRQLTPAPALPFPADTTPYKVTTVLLHGVVSPESSCMGSYPQRGGMLFFAFRLLMRECFLGLQFSVLGLGFRA